MLSLSNLQIPDYQRPYKWTTRNVNQLINDIIYQNQNNPSVNYRLGTIVYHAEDNNLNIVDGQQRTLTLFLIAFAIMKHRQNDIKILLDRSKNEINFEPKASFSFSNDLSKQNLNNNYSEIERRVKYEFSAELVGYFYCNCEVVTIVLDSISEAFQFFDSQNSRGKDLEPHDLLKAFHLREMSELSEEIKKKCIASWEEKETKELSNLFGKYLYRIKNWSRGKSAKSFTKEDIDTFKGINLRSDNYTYSIIYKMAHNYKIHKQLKLFPFQIDQPIINGKYFFEMVDYYFNKLEKIVDGSFPDNSFDNGRIFPVINNYPGMYRTGDKYVRNLFNCALFYFIDRFGTQNPEIISKAVKLFFVWAYSLRLDLFRVYIESVDNYALEKLEGMFTRIHDAIRPSDIINITLNKQTSINATKIEKIIEKFGELGYYDE